MAPGQPPGTARSRAAAAPARARVRHVRIRRLGLVHARPARLRRGAAARRRLRAHRHVGGLAAGGEGAGVELAGFYQFGGHEPLGWLFEHRRTGKGVELDPARAKVALLFVEQGNMREQAGEQAVLHISGAGSMSGRGFSGAAASRRFFQHWGAVSETAGNMSNHGVSVAADWMLGGRLPGSDRATLLDRRRLPEGGAGPAEPRARHRLPGRAARRRGRSGGACSDGGFATRYPSADWDATHYPVAVPSAAACRSPGRRCREGQ